MQKKLRMIFLGIILIILLIAFGLNLFTRINFWLSLLVGLGIVLISAMVGFLFWANHPMGPEQVAQSCLTSPDGINIQFEKYGLVLTPCVENDPPAKNMGVIFYPGGRVHHLAYLPVLQRLVCFGYPVFLVRMPCYMAVFDYQRAGKVMAMHPEVSNWAIGGHSLGGAMAAHYAARHPKRFRGLFLWGAYPSERDNFSTLGLPVQMICAECDGITTQEKVDRVRAQLPADVRWMEIEGGNHAQFGDYGPERKDSPAKLSANMQWDMIAGEMGSFLAGIAAQESAAVLGGVNEKMIGIR